MRGLAVVPILLSALLAVQGANNTNTPNGDLVTVIVVYRHGDRTPVDPYPTDPYKNRSYWPVGFGQLTNLGKQQHFELGKWLRARYDGFLPAAYSEEDIYIRSTDVDRTLMSAYSNLAGMYQPTGKQVWNPSIDWQPIPVHTLPEKEDYVLAMKRPCDKFTSLLKDLMKTPEFVDIAHKSHDLFAYITRSTGRTVTTMEAMEFIYNTLFIEEIYNYTLPDWTKKVYPDKMLPLAVLSFAVPCYTEELTRLKTGPLFNEFVKHLVDARHSKDKKMKIYSAHDTTIANVLNTMGLFEYHSPPYASTVIFELRVNADKHFVNIFYKNTTEPRQLKLKNCAVDCPLEEFVKILQPILITPEKWFEECQVSIWQPFLLFFSFPDIIIIVCSMMFMTLILSIVFGIFYSKPKSEKRSYLRLPDSDEAA